MSKQLKKLTFYLIPIWIALILLAYICLLKTEAEQLLTFINLEDAALPSQIVFVRDGERVIDAVDWIYNSTPVALSKRNFKEAMFAPVPFDRIWLAGWNDDSGSRYLNVAIIDYQYPLLAWIGFELNKPSIRSRGSWNFVYAPKDVVPKNWEEYSSGDENLVQCGNGHEELCGEWYYQARYGQFYLLIELPGAANADSFNEIVKAIVFELEQNLER